MIQYNDARLSESLNAILTYIEGTFGAMVMVAGGLAAVLLACVARFRLAGVCLLIAVGAFITRSLVGTFFNDYSLGDGGSNERPYRYYSEPSRAPQPGFQTSLHDGAAAAAARAADIFDFQRDPLKAILINHGQARSDAPRGAPAASTAEPVQPAAAQDHENTGGPARRFFASRDRITGLAFQPAQGAWSNTYLPGIEPLRRLRQALQSYNLPSARWSASENNRPDDSAALNQQPFDPPAAAALKLHMLSDRAAIPGPARVLLQVGLQGAKRRGSRRAAAAIALVFNLEGPLSAQLRIQYQQLLEAFRAEKESGDSFFLILATAAGPIAIEPGDFRHGPLTLALDQAWAQAPAGPRQEGLTAALRLAAEKIRRTGDASAETAVAAVVLAAHRPLGKEAAASESLAREIFEGGASFSALALPGAEHRELMRLAAAGQGAFGVARTAADAAAAVQRELAAARRVIAREVHLDIRLAPGVRLVKVVGAEPLAADAAGAQAAAAGPERSGIQIAIPAFYAGDAHTVLLDVVTERPGPLAEASLRCYDMIKLAQTSAEAQLTLPSGDAPRGPLALSVIKNLLAYRLAAALQQAGELNARQPAAALAALDDFHRLLADLKKTTAGLARDKDLNRDLLLLEQYRRLLESAIADRSLNREHLSNSLRFAALLKVLPRPVL